MVRKGILCGDTNIVYLTSGHTINPESITIYV